MIDQTVSHFKVLEKLGEGRAGVVYKAKDLDRKRVVVLKFFPKERLGSERDRGRFVHEAESATVLDHTNICRIHEVFDEGNNVVVAMNYVGGKSLRQIIDERRLDFDAAIDYAIQIAEGIEAAHASNFIHRDIKSANVMVTNVGGARITDFGLARPLELIRAQRDSLAPGMASYLSPEQIRGGEVDRQSDIWSLGVVMYEMIAGRLPFRASHESKVVSAIVRQDPEPLSSVRPGTPAAIERVVAKAMAKNWEDRYHNAGEMLADLRKIQAAIRAGEDLPTEAEAKAKAKPRPRSIPRPKLRVPPKLLKSRATWVTVAAVVVVLAVVIVLTRGPGVPFDKRDWIVVADFENLAGQAIYDRSLDVALAMSLDQSTYVNVYPRRRSQETLARMKRPEVERIDADTAREIAVFDGVTLVVVPGITSVGEDYTLTAAIRNAATGLDLRSEGVEASGRDAVLGALDELARKIRSELGEPGRSISRASKPVGEAATSSLTALKGYALGYDEHQRGRYEEAKGHYELAVQRDSTFAIALHSLGMLEYLHFNRAVGVQHIREALVYADEATVPEAAAIKAGHAIAVEEDMEKAARIYEASVAAYPDISINQNNLGTIYSMLGRYQDAARQYQEAIRAEPTMMIAYNGLVSEYLQHLGRVDLAFEWLKRQMAYEPQSSWPYYNLGYACIGIDNYDRAVSALQEAIAFDPELTEALSLLGHTYRLVGQYDESLKMFGRLLEADPDAVEIHYFMGVVCDLRGDKKRAADYYDRYRRVTQWRTEDNPDDAGYFLDLGIVLTRIGQTARARAAAEKAAALDTTDHIKWARLRSVQGEADASFEHLERAIAGGFRDLIMLKYHPDFQPIHDDPRLAELLNRYLQT